MNRRMLKLVAAALLALVIAGCGKNADPNPNPSNTGGGSSGGTTTNNPGSNTGANSGGNNANAGTNGNNNNAGNSNTGGTKPPPTTEKVNLTGLKVGEPAKLGPLTVTVTQVVAVDQVAGLQQGYVYAMVEIDVKNDGAPYTINVTEHFRMETPEGKKANYNMQAAAQRSPKLQGTVEKGQSTKGWLGHLTKSMAGAYTFKYTHPDLGDATWEFSLQ